MTTILPFRSVFSDNRPATAKDYPDAVPVVAVWSEGLLCYAGQHFVKPELGPSDTSLKVVLGSRGSGR